MGVKHRARRHKCRLACFILPIVRLILGRILVELQRQEVLGIRIVRTPCGQEELQNVALDGSLRKAEMQIGDDVARWRKHALILAEHSQLYKGRLPVQSSPQSFDMTSDSESTLRAAHDLELRVRYAETDQMGVVYHANYLVWCEMGRTDFIRRCGVSYADMERGGRAGNGRLVRMRP